MQCRATLKREGASSRRFSLDPLGFGVARERAPEVSTGILSVLTRLLGMRGEEVPDQSRRVVGLNRHAKDLPAESADAANDRVGQHGARRRGHEALR